LEADGAYGLIKVLRDVTERQTAERRLQQSEQLFRTLAELLPSMVFVLREGDIVYANQRFFDAATHLTFNQDGEKADDVIDLFVPACRPAVAQDLARRLAGENISSRECRISDASGREIPVILSLEAFEDDGRVTVIGVLSDISVQKQAETERRKMEARMALAAHQASIGVMASGIAHEINNPLTGVIGFSQLLAQRPDLPEDIRDDAAIIDSGAQRVAGIIRRLLTFADPRPPRQEPADLNNLVSETLKSMAAELEHHGIELILELSPELPQVITDASQIQQAFLNIIKNAVTELHKLEGAKRLTVTTEVRGRMTAVTFADNGPGIPPDNLPRIFDPFFTTREVGQGTGLGLSVCHGIITRNSGCITAANRPEGGAVFTVELPQTVG
jgi:PAS domain S-box-containing protein